MNKKGFLLAEAIIVAVFVLGMFTFIALNVLPLTTKYEIVLRYDNPNEVYLANKFYLELKKTSDPSFLSEPRYYYNIIQTTESETEGCQYYNSEENLTSCSNLSYVNVYLYNLANGLGIKEFIYIGNNDTSLDESIFGNNRGIREYTYYLIDRNNGLDEKEALIVKFKNNKYASVIKGGS